MAYLKHKIEVDTHVHTVVSGHAWSTFGENVDQAVAIGLKGMCITEHSCHVPNTPPEWLAYNELMLPESYKGVRTYRGMEADITDCDGTVAPPEKYLEMLEFVICSIHTFFSSEPVSAAKWTETYLNALDRNPLIDVLGHIDRLPCDMETIVKAAKRADTMIEINRGSLGRYNDKGTRLVFELAGYCKKHDVRVCVGTDSHLHMTVGDFDPACELLEAAQFPPELILNYNIADFEAYVEEKQKKYNIKTPKRFG